MRFFLTAFFLCCISLFAAAQSDSVSVNFIQALNELRSNPGSFDPLIDEYYYEWRSYVTNRKELEKAVREIKRRLKTQPKLRALMPDSNLLKAALDHANDSYNMNVVGHIGSDGSNPGTRVKRYSSAESVSECITYGQKTSRLMLAALLVDEGSPSRGHRETLLSADFIFIGVAVAPHPRYDYQCVVVLAGK